MPHRQPLPDLRFPDFPEDASNDASCRFLTSPSAHASAGMRGEGRLCAPVCVGLFEGCDQVEQHHIFLDDLKAGVRLQVRRP